MMGYFEKGENVINNEWILRFVRERIPPPERQGYSGCST